ncbi:MFS transporter [uncultured Pseudonocardia sp.]|uniref:MFS transporter n=1 Tax=uncultured Pseudonocardia sp. TaxID=211455 RepID=UPI0026153659|nr:MFS transporter [uncultured Pseudonocardia sp.]
MPEPMPSRGGPPPGGGAPRPGLSPWRFVTAFGVISLLSDVVYEGARSITGPLLAGFGASAALVGVITGVGEAAALVLRLGSGPLADRGRHYWGWTIGGYALTVAAVPLLGLAGALWVACALVITERVGKAVRSPAKDTLLSHATAAVGRGRGFAVHEALDQIGAVAGPLLIAAGLAVTASYRPALLALAVPGAVVLGLLWWLRARVPHPIDYEPDTEPTTTAAAGIPGGAHPRDGAPTGNARRAAGPVRAAGLPREFWIYAGFAALTMSGFATFGVLSFHLATRGLLPAPAIPLLYAAAMAVDALAALATGFAYDRVGTRVLVVLPVLAAVVPVLAFSSSTAVAVAGSLVWGAAVGVQESTLRAVVADLVPPTRRATGYGIFAGAYGGAALIGGTLAGALYEKSVTLLIVVTAVVQLAALGLLLAVRTRRSPHSQTASS